ncbi:WD_REPEATS_REGION domain-containing protein, partial [Haematococcus lacustris]
MASSEVSDTAELQDGALINPRFAFGMTGQGQYAMTYLDGGKLVYPVGVHLALYSSHQEEDVSVYSLATSKRVKALPIEPGMTGGCTAIQSLNFSENSKLLITQWGDPSYILHIWSPVDDTLLVTLGPSLVSLYKLDGETGGCRTMVVATLDDGLGAFSCVAWLMGNLLALGRESGHLQVNQDAEVKGLLLPDPEDSLTTLVARGRGLVAGGRKGRLYFYDPPDASLRKSGSKEVFLLTRTLDAHIPGRAISALAVSSGEDGLALCTSNNELLLLSLSSVLEREEKQLDTVLGKGFGLLDDQ